MFRKSLISSSISAPRRWLGPLVLLMAFLVLFSQPFFSHRNSVSELVGDKLKVPTEEILTANGISYRKTKRAEKVQGMDQALTSALLMSSLRRS